VKKQVLVPKEYLIPTHSSFPFSDSSLPFSYVRGSGKGSSNTYLFTYLLQSGKVPSRVLSLFFDLLSTVKVK